MWHMDYFELKAIKAPKTQEEIFTFPQLPKIIQTEGLFQDGNIDNHNMS